MRINCDKGNPPLGGVLAAEFYKSLQKPVDIVWGSESSVVLTNGSTAIPYEGSNDLIRILERSFNDIGNPAQNVVMNHWLTFCLNLENDMPNAVGYLDKILGPSTYLIDPSLSVADLAVFAILNASNKFSEISNAKTATNVLRWMKLVNAQPSVAATLKSLPSGVITNLNKMSNMRDEIRKKGSGGRQQEGKFIELPYAEMGKVVVRFPPEASGYLHIGHAKAALLNQYYQQAFDGKLIMRFDDTNPAKENAEFEKVILSDLEMLEIKPDMFTHTSQYFDLMLRCCEKLIKAGKAFVDDTPAEEMKNERDQKVDSRNRNNSVEFNLKLWEEMKKGSDIGIKCCVRAKIDMKSPNGCLRDPTIYRCKPEPHPRTGTQYKVYPTYDFACPIVDSLEGVTHVLRTMEYHDRDPQFYWFIDALGIRKPYIWEYSRLSMTNTVLSKRKLTWFVEQGLVDGWDDPRMPTVRGVLRRGMTVEGLRQFIQAQGSSRSVVFMEWDKIWAINKKVIDPVAPRYTALESERVPVNLKNVSSECIIVALHPKNPKIGNKSVWISERLLIDEADASTLKEGENTTFINYGNVIIDKIHTTEDGTVTSIDATPNLENKDYKKTLKITWLADTPQSPMVETYCVYFDHIISKPLLAKEEDFKNFIRRRTRWEIPMLGEPELSKVQVGDIIQLQRRGFFRVDVAPAAPSPLSGKARPLILFHIPDGHTKEMPGQSKPFVRAFADQPSTSKDAGHIRKFQPLIVKSPIDLDKDITAQGDLVRSLKSSNANKARIDEAVRVLLQLKAKYKETTGRDWKPTTTPASVRTETATTSSASAPTQETKMNGNSEELNKKIAEQGNKVRTLKEQKADKATVQAEVKILLNLKAEFKTITGTDWSPSATAPTTSQVPKQEAKTNGNEEELNTKIAEQGNKVRTLKEQKADKATVQAEVKTLLNLKEEFKTITGTDWSPSATAPTTSQVPKQEAKTNGNEEELNTKIAEQGNKVRTLKEQKADKATVQAEVKTLLNLKEEFKKITGTDWSPSATAPTTSQVQKQEAKTNGNEEELNTKIAEQGNKVRTLKEQKADKATVQAEVKTLLNLKEEFKTITGTDWSPSATAPTTSQVPKQEAKTNGNEEELNTKIAEQGNKVRTLKEQKADKATVQAEVKTLLNLKAEFKKITGTDWSPSATAPTTSQVPKQEAKTNGNEEELNTKIAEQGNKVRTLKEQKADKATVQAEVQVLLALKASYKETTGNDWTPSATVKASKPNEKKEAKPKEVKPKESKPKEQTPKPVKEESGSGVKKITRLGLEASKDKDLPEWYSQVITKSEMIEYYDISGCYILRPWSFGIWDIIRDFLSAEFKKIGVKDCYFPIFVSKAALEREKTHIADFAPEVAWVTHSGSSELAEHIAVRPTSETVMYPAYAKWIQSHRDLPLKLNQWNNVVRWEFKQPQPFIRTREFLWQEGHTAFLTREEADKEVLHVLDLYARVYEDLLAIPVIRGRKTEKEKFAGGDYTTTVEAYVPASGRGIQGATSHHLGQNFSKMFEIIYDDPETQEKKYVFQNSWGITTRTIGVMILVHGDDRGLVLPPRVAAVQVIVVPCGITANSTPEDRENLKKSCEELVKQLADAGIRAEGDYRDNYSPGWKFNHWELKGVPIRVELGPKDIAKGEIVAVRRLTGEKISLKRDYSVKELKSLLETTHEQMLARATEERDSRLSDVTEWDQFTTALEKKHILLAPFCGETPCEDNIKNDSARVDEDDATDVKAPAMGAKSLCIPFKQPRDLKPTDKCIHPACKNKPKFITLFGRSY